MNLIIAVKRHLFLFVVVVVLTMPSSVAPLLAEGAVSGTEECNLPMEAASADANKQEESPPEPPDGEAVLHQGKFILCLPPSAAEAHIRHGDTPLGPCDKHGRVK
jgi:hypothetical protein